jgi:predicted alternative tryptophan synthase beta-subunit
MPEELTLSLTLDDVQRARQRIASCVRRTPLVPSVTLSERLKTNVYVKLELFQKTGSFKMPRVLLPSAEATTPWPLRIPAGRSICRLRS